MRDLPRFHGMPVPISVMRDLKGVPDFAATDLPLGARLAEQRCCAICGKRMRGLFAFIGGPTTLEGRRLRDGPMHVECARYSMTVCPFVSGSHRQYRDPLGSTERHGQPMVTTALVAPVPSRMVMQVVRDYRVHPNYLYEPLGEPVLVEWTEA